MAKRSELVPVPASEVTPSVLPISNVVPFQRLFRFPPDCRFIYPSTPGQPIVIQGDPRW